MLTDMQLIVIGIVASAIVWTLKLTQAKLSAGWLSALVYVVAAALAYIFVPVALPAFPPFTDLATFIPAVIAWVGALLIPLSAFAGFATLVYNVLLKTILEKYVRPAFAFVLAKMLTSK